MINKISCRQTFGSCLITPDAEKLIEKTANRDWGKGSFAVTKKFLEKSPETFLLSVDKNSKKAKILVEIENYGKVSIPVKRLFDASKTVKELGSVVWENKLFTFLKNSKSLF